VSLSIFLSKQGDDKAVNVLIFAILDLLELLSCIIAKVVYFLFQPRKIHLFDSLTNDDVAHIWLFTAKT
jgi:hypothetical protein